MCSTAGIQSKTPLMALPNELFLKVASHLKSFRDLNSLVCTSRRFHTMFNADLYRRVVAADDIVLYYTVCWVLSSYRLASLTLLLDNGLSVNYTVCSKNGHGRFYSRQENMLYFLCELIDQESSVPLARLLIHRGADIGWSRDSFSDSVLCRAISNNNYPIAALLLEHGADVNAAEHNGYRALHFACERMDADNPEMVHLLIAHGADIEARSECGDTPLTIFEFDDHKPRIMAALLEHGADAGVHNDIGETPLHCVSAWLGSEHHELAKSLLEHGADVKATTDQGETPLHWLLMHRWSPGGLFMARFLLENGADVNAVSNDGHSILQYALSHFCTVDVVALLLEYGADVSQLNTEERQILTEFLS
jgi:ankyrin repeat protein